MISSPVSSQTFIGRRAELAFLKEQSRAVIEGQAIVVSIIGEAGIGKSRLIHHFCEQLKMKSIRYAVGHCIENLQAPYLPFKEILEQLTAKRAMPHRPSYSHSADASQEDKYEYFQAICQTLRTLATRTPIFAVIEDLHWADHATIELIEFVSMHLRDVPMLLLLTSRSDALDSSPHVVELLGKLSRLGGSRMYLPALSREEIRFLVRSTAQGMLELSAEAVRRIEDASEGNPLFAEEMLRSMFDAEQGLNPGGIPLSIRGMLAERLSSLPERDRDILAHAAVIGRSFEVDFLADITHCDRADVLQTLQLARGLQLIVEHESVPHRYAFRHAVIRESLYAEILRDVAGPLHARIATILENSEDADSHVAELAYHWYVAGIEDRAIKYNEQAGDAAEAVFAYHDASRYYQRALEFPHPLGARHAALSEKFANVLYVEGSGSEASQWFSKAFHEYERLGDRDSMAKVLINMARQSWRDSRTEESLYAASQVIGLFAHGEVHPAVIRAQLEMARLCITLGRTTDAQTHLKKVEPLDLSASHDMSASYYEIKGEVAAACGEIDESLSHFDRAVEIAQTMGSVDVQTRIENAYALTAADLGETQIAIAHHERALHIARKYGLSWRTAFALVNYAQTLVLLGRVDEAQELFVRARELGTSDATIHSRLCITGLQLAIHTGNVRLLNEMLDPESVESSFASAEIQRIGGIVASFVGAYIFQQRPEEEAQALIGRALPALSCLHRSWAFAIVVAKAGTETQIQAVRRLLRQYGKDYKATRVSTAVSGLFEALVHQRGNRKKEAAELAKKVKPAFEEMGWHVWAREAEDVRNPVRAAKRIARTAVTLPVMSINLTPRQREIAMLVRAGITNKEIGGSLGITENTVERHLTEIYDRLRMVSRAQLAAWVENSLAR